MIDKISDRSKILYYDYIEKKREKFVMEYFENEGSDTQLFEEGEYDGKSYLIQLKIIVDE